MNKTYIKLAILNFRKNKKYFFLNIMGLSLGVAAIIIILLYTSYERSFDKFYPQSEQIYRLKMERSSSSSENSYAAVPGSIGLGLKEEFPEIKELVRMRGVNSTFSHTSTLNFNDNRIFSDEIFFTDPTYFSVFKHEFIQGSPESALIDPNTVVLTQSLAKKLFGETDPMNKTIQYSYRYTMHNAMVTGIIKDLPETTHLHIEALVSINSIDLLNRYNEAISGALIYTYFLLNDDESGEQLANKIPKYYDRALKARLDSLNIRYKFDLQPIQSIHLESDLIYEAYQNGNKKNITVFIFSGFFLILLAVFNYVNIMTAISGSRIREVAMRKILGAKRDSLVLQFLTESVVLSLIATIIAVIIVVLLLPWFNSFMSIQLDLFSSQWLLNISLLFFGSLVLGLISGFYPALMISKFPPLVFIQGSSLTKGKQRGLLRKILVVLQLFISVTVIVSAIIVTKQFNYAMTKDPGYNPENVIAFQVKDTVLINHLQAVKNDLKTIPGVLRVAASSDIPGRILNSSLGSGINSDGSSIQLPCNLLQIDETFMDLMQAKMLLGNDFDSTYTSKENVKVVINETAMRKFGWDDLGDGKRFSFGNYQGKDAFRIIGVVKDFNWMSVREEVQPLVIMCSERPMAIRMYIYVRYVPDTEASLLSGLRDYFNTYNLISPMEFYFLDDKISSQYRLEKKMMIILNILMFLNIVIACLGLIGLVSYISNLKRKEFSIRKVFGALSVQNFYLVSKEFLFLITISNIIAWPITYYFMKDWLDNFVYHIDLNLIIFLYAYAITIGITFITISGHLLRAVRENPIHALRHR